jgi:hypothetical protein
MQILNNCDRKYVHKQYIITFILTVLSPGLTVNVGQVRSAISLHMSVVSVSLFSWHLHEIIPRLDQSSSGCNIKFYWWTAWDGNQVSMMKNQQNVNLYVETVQYWSCNFLPRCHTEVMCIVAARCLRTPLCLLQEVLVTNEVSSGILISQWAPLYLFFSESGMFVTGSVPK